MKSQIEQKRAELAELESKLAQEKSATALQFALNLKLDWFTENVESLETFTMEQYNDTMGSQNCQKGVLFRMNIKNSPLYITCTYGRPVGGWRYIESFLSIKSTLKHEPLNVNLYSISQSSIYWDDIGFPFPGIASPIEYAKWISNLELFIVSYMKNEPDILIDIFAFIFHMGFILDI